MPPLHSLLLIDPEPQTLEVLKFAFGREGCEVVTAQTAKQAAAVARQATPQAVVIHAGSAAAGAAAFCADLRRDEALRDLPILVVGDGRARKLTLDAGATAHLASPAYLRDIVTLARLLAGAGTVVSVQPGPESRGAYDATLAEYGLYFLMRAMAAGGLGAVLSLNRQGKRGELHVAAGQITVARVGGVSGLPALHTLLLWSEASLAVRFYGAQQARQLPHKAEELLADAERFLRDFRAAAATLGPPDAVLVQDISVVAQRIGHIPSQVAPVLRLFDGCRTITDMAADSPFTAFDSLRIAQRLQELGAIKRLQITPPASEVVRGEIVGRSSSGRVPTPGSSLDPPSAIVESTSLAERLEAVLASQEPIPLLAPKRKEPAVKAPQADPFAGVVPTAALAGPTVVEPFGGEPTERTEPPIIMLGPPVAAPAPAPGAAAPAPPPAAVAPKPATAAPKPAAPVYQPAPPPAAAAPPPAATPPVYTPVAAPPPARVAPQPAYVPVAAPAPVVYQPVAAPPPAAPPVVYQPVAAPPPAVPPVVYQPMAAPPPAPAPAAPPRAAPAPAAPPRAAPAPAAPPRAAPMAAAPAPAPAPPVGSPPKKPPAMPAEPPRDPNRPQTNPHFSRLEMEFFAQAERLQTLEAPDTFDDLFDENEGKPGWFGIKKPTPAASPRGGNGQSGQAKGGGKPGGKGGGKGGGGKRR